MVSNIMIRELIKAFTVLSVMLFVCYLLMADIRNQKAGVYYDCTLASFHPDIPLTVKEACRLRHTQTKINNPPKNDSTKH